MVVERVDRAAAVEAGLEAQQRAAQAADPARVDADGPGEVAELGQVALGQAVAAGTRAAGAGGDPPPAVTGDANPAVRGEADAARLVQAQGGDDALEGPGDALAGAAEAAVGVERDASADQEGGLPGGAAGALAAGGLGGHVDRVGADDRGAVEIDAGGRHLEADERHDRLDLARLGLGAVLDLGDRGGEAVVVDARSRWQPSQRRARK